MPHPPPSGLPLPSAAPTARPLPGLYLAHKPKGATSFSLVQAFQARLDEVPGKRLKLCHGGALDPFAEGLLPMLVGPATRLFERLHEVPKTYLATVAWGAETDSLDLLGTVLERADPSALTPARLDEALKRFLGHTAQLPPAMSNKRVDGERAWKRARRGETVVLSEVQVYLHSARFTAHALPQESTLELTCGGGFYVRALARDLGRALGTRAHLKALRRTRIGPWDDAEGEPRHLHGEALLPWLPARSLGDDEVGALRRDRQLPSKQPAPPSWALPAGFPGPRLVRALHQGRLVALLEPADGLHKLHTELPGGC